MAKKRTTLTIDEKLFYFASHLGINLSSFLEERLEYFQKNIDRSDAREPIDEEDIINEEYIREHVKGNDHTTPEQREIIVQTLMRCPEDVAIRALQGLFFISIGDEMKGQQFDICPIRRLDKCNVYPNRRFDYSDTHLDKYVELRYSCVLLNFSILKYFPRSRQRDIVAHEIAHFILDNARGSPKPGNGEKDTDDLIEKWGFNRAYTEEEWKERQEYLQKHNDQSPLQ